MAEWSIALDCKSSVQFTVSGVRISLPPQILYVLMPTSNGGLVGLKRPKRILAKQ